MANYANQKLDSAFYFYNRSKILSELENDSLIIVYNLVQMAVIQEVFGDYVGSEKNLIEVLPYSQGNLLYQASAFNQLGISSKQLFNYEDASYYYDKAWIYRERIRIVLQLIQMQPLCCFLNY